jgi:conjugal transfer pilus assembly protein TraV
MTARPIAAAIVSLSLAACGSLSGLDAKDQFACKAPDGVLCESMTGIYANAQANNLPGQRVSHGASGGDPANPAPAAEPGSGVLTKPIYSGTPIRTAPLVLRVWIAPWEDTDGDLHDQSYLYMPVDSGKWLIEHNRRRIQDAYRPVRPPVAQGPAPAGAQGRIKVTPPGAPSVDQPAPRASSTSAADFLNGLLKPGAPAAPAQAEESD